MPNYKRSSDTSENTGKWSVLKKIKMQVSRILLEMLYLPLQVTRCYFSTPLSGDNRSIETAYMDGLALCLFTELYLCRGWGEWNHQEQYWTTEFQALISLGLHWCVSIVQVQTFSKALYYSSLLGLLWLPPLPLPAKWCLQMLFATECCIIAWHIF